MPVSAMQRRHRGRVQRDVRAQRLQHVGAAGAGRDAAPAMLGHARAGRRGDEHRRRRNVEGVRGIAAGAAEVDQVGTIGRFHLGRELAHDLRRRGDLADRLLLDAQAHRQRGDLHRRQFAAHQPSPQRQHLVLEDLAVLDAPDQGFGGGNRHGSSFRADVRDAARRTCIGTTQISAPPFGRPGVRRDDKCRSKGLGEHHRFA